MQIIRNCINERGKSFMKTKKILLVSILILVFLTSCQQKDTLINLDNYETSETQDKDVKYNYTVTGESSDDFFYLISDNPIDLRQKELLKEYDGSSSMLIKVASKYEEFWYREMEVAYNQLLKLVDEEDRQNLINSQTSWESYMENKKHIQKSFYSDHKYDVVGTLRTALSVEENAEETKARAYSLLEYLYIITGEINLVFSSEEW